MLSLPVTIKRHQPHGSSAPWGNAAIENVINPMGRQPHGEILTVKKPSTPWVTGRLQFDYFFTRRFSMLNIL